MSLSRALHFYPLDDHFVAFREGSDRLQIINALARQVLGAPATSDMRQFALALLRDSGALPRAEAERVVSRLLLEFEQSGLLGPLPPSSQKNDSKPGQAQACVAPAACQVLDYRIGPRHFQVHYGDQDLLAAVSPWLEHLQVSVAQPGASFRLARDAQGWLLMRDQQLLLRTGKLQDLVLATLFHASEQVRHDGEHLMTLHAGAVCQAGRALAFSGPSGSGKSTLVAYLLHRGFELVADDMLPVRAADGLLEPAPACISLKPGSWPLIGRLRPELLQMPVFTTPDKQIRLLPPPASVRHAPVPLAGLIYCRYVADAPQSIRVLTAREAFVRMIQSQAYLPRPLTVERVAQIVSWTAAQPAYELRFRALAEAHDGLLRLIE